jgi:thioredoxin-dependent peroxiredoxin
VLIGTRRSLDREQEVYEKGKGHQDNSPPARRKVMKIQNGEPAKDFQVEDLFGKQITLGDFKGKKMMLSFYRYASCPLCNLRVHQLIQRYPDLHEKGLEMVAFFQSPPETIYRYVGKQDAPFSIVPDPDREVYKLYGVEGSLAGFLKASLKVGDLISAVRKGFLPGRIDGETTMVPADFLIGPALVVEKAYYGKDIGDHMPIQEIEAWLGV